MVEHSTADREVPGSNPGVPSCFAMCFATKGHSIFLRESAWIVTRGRRGARNGEIYVFSKMRGNLIPLGLHVTPSEQHM